MEDGSAKRKVDEAIVSAESSKRTKTDMISYQGESKSALVERRVSATPVCFP